MLGLRFCALSLTAQTRLTALLSYSMTSSITGFVFSRFLHPSSPVSMLRLDHSTQTDKEKP